MAYKFAAASDNESIVFGSARPGHGYQKLALWTQFMEERDIRQVCCLLSDAEVAKYSDLLATYRAKFGLDRVCWSPMADFELCDRQTLISQVLPFLVSADRAGERVVVHCAGGIGRTGQVLAAWLVSMRGFSNREAISCVKRTGRNPHEAAIAAAFKGRNPRKVVRDLDELLDDCRRAISQKKAIASE